MPDVIPSTLRWNKTMAFEVLVQSRLEPRSMEKVGVDSVNLRFPETQQEADEADRIVTEELSKLSLVEQEKILFELHGLAQSYEEDPPDMDRRLDELEEQIRQIPNRASYERAYYYDPSYVEDPKFRVMFLRSERYNVKLAAQRLVKHFSLKEKWFGSGEILSRDIQLSDMSKEDMQVLESGYIQVLPSRDVAGRSVFCFSMMHRPKGASIASLNRTYWYMLTTTLRDEETQKKGMVAVEYNIGAHAKADPTLILTQLDSVIQGIPKKWMGLHYCFDDESLRPYVMGLQLFLDKEVQGRFRPHFGKNAEFTLQTYGIPTKDQPIHPNGELSLAWHREWLNVRGIQEASDQSVDGIIVPRRFDVLFGRGKGTREHTGNLRAVHIVELLRPQYDDLSRLDKTKLSARVVSMIHESLGRFLKWEDQGWVEVSDEVARAKVSHFFRHRRCQRDST